MVKIVVPSHCSRYIVTATDLANYLRNHFGEGHDFQIEVTRELLLYTCVVHRLTTTDSIPMTCGTSKVRRTFQTYVACVTALISRTWLTDVCCSQRELMYELLSTPDNVGLTVWFPGE